jgi:hypothetical protein
MTLFTAISSPYSNKISIFEFLELATRLRRKIATDYLKIGSLYEEKAMYQCKILFFVI